jgi:hypothetical protein
MIAKPLTPPTTPSRITSTTTGTTMGVQVAALTGTNTGGSTILSYELLIDTTGTGTGTFSEVSGYTTLSTSTTFTILSLTSGSTYCFKYRAYNVMGWGPYSSIGCIIMAAAPD